MYRLPRVTSPKKKKTTPLSLLHTEEPENFFLARWEGRRKKENPFYPSTLSHTVNEDAYSVTKEGNPCRPLSVGGKRHLNLRAIRRKRGGGGARRWLPCVASDWRWKGESPRDGRKKEWSRYHHRGFVDMWQTTYQTHQRETPPKSWYCG